MTCAGVDAAVYIPWLTFLDYICISVYSLLALSRIFGLSRQSAFATCAIKNPGFERSVAFLKKLVRLVITVIVGPRV